MPKSTFTPTLRQQVSLSFAYLTYDGEDLTGSSTIPTQILETINKTMPTIPPLLDSKKNVDWQVVWGPAIYTFPDAIYQDNMMFVAQQNSPNANNYVIAVRGTNGKAILDFIEEDLEVWAKVPWSVPAGVPVQGSPMISKATQNGINVLLKELKPVKGIPGYPNDITKFLKNLATSGKVNLLFTGHSLGGALAPTLALWFKQSQKIAGGWDPQGNATISTVAFAGPTAGDQDFANFFNKYFFNKQLAGTCERIYNTLDVVPHAWEQDTLDQLPNIYSPTIKMPLAEQLLVDFIERTVKGYVQIDGGIPITWTVQPTKHPSSYVEQLATQHGDSYPTLLNVPALLLPKDTTST